MSLLDPIVPFLGPFGQVLAASDLIVVGLVCWDWFVSDLTW